MTMKMDAVRACWGAQRKVYPRHAHMDDGVHRCKQGDEDEENDIAGAVAADDGGQQTEAQHRKEEDVDDGGYGGGTGKIAVHGKSPRKPHPNHDSKRPRADGPGLGPVGHGGQQEPGNNGSNKTKQHFVPVPCGYVIPDVRRLGATDVEADPGDGAPGGIKARGKEERTEPDGEKGEGPCGG